MRRQVELAWLILSVLALSHEAVSAQEPIAPRPSYASGRLWWVPSPPLWPFVFWEPESPDSMLIKLELDVAVRGLMGLPKPEAPVWRGELLGEEFGLTSQYLTVAGVNLPSFLLALVPLSAISVSPEQSAATYRRNEQRREIDLQESRRVPCMPRRADSTKKKAKNC